VKMLFRYLFLNAGWAILLSSQLAANPAHRAAIAKHFGSFLPEKLQNCSLCHHGEDGEEASSLEEFPHNVFGNAFRVAGVQLATAKQDDAIAQRLEKIAEMDVDGDGISNLAEILLGSFPGDATDFPNSSDLSRKEERITAYHEKLAQYAWRPFLPVVRPQTPPVAGTWEINAVDSFVSAKHQSLRLTPQEETRPEYLLRRVYVDLIGLTPSAEEIAKFVKEYQQDRGAYDRVVTQLLDHPGYGERWGRHWMDVWRYSDWAGYKDALRESQRHIWHWRDWIVESLNEDVGYDQMLTRMLAADEMQLGDSQLRATGYLARNYFTNRDQWMDNLVKHTSQAFMGVTLGCAKCHDHMTDPFMQREYYALRAIFETHAISTNRVIGELDINVNGIPRAYDQSISTKTYLYQRGDERFPDKTKPIEPGVPTVLGGNYSVQPVSLTYQATHPDQRSFVLDELRAEIQQRITKATEPEEIAALQLEMEAFDAELSLENLESQGISQNSDQWIDQAKELSVLQRRAEMSAADWKLILAKKQLDKVTQDLETAEKAKDKTAISKAAKAKTSAEKAFKDAKTRAEKAQKAIDSEVTTKFKRRQQTTFPETSSGRRLAFANWLTDSANPLTARVAVNHIWARHFGRGIVPTTNDFGTSGEMPTHPALLDWLAAELMKQNWSMKAIHRLIVTSATYRMNSSSTMANQAIDPDNHYYWRRNVQRMEGEIVRDNLLHVSGRLDSQLGGPDIDQNLAQQSRRRSIYLRHAHEKLVEFVQIFDGPAVSECYMRETSIQPHQALALANSPLSVDAAAAICNDLKKRFPEDDAAFIRQLFLRILGRTETQKEATMCQSFLSESSRGHMNLALVLLNHNDFVTVR